MTEELRALDHLAHHLPDHAVAAIEEFDPDRRALWHASQFVTDDEPILGRPVVERPARGVHGPGGQAAGRGDLGGRRRPGRAVRDRAGRRATRSPRRPRRLAARSAPCGPATPATGSTAAATTSAGSPTPSDQAAAVGFFGPRCDRVRVMPFLDGVPCSIHGIVLPDGTAVFRPVEIAILRDVAGRQFVYGGLSTYWDPPPADREEMRDVARRVGEHLQAAYGYRGAFGIDGVLTADGFRPTELNTRMSAGLTTDGGGRPRPVRAASRPTCSLGLDTGLTVADLESLVPLMDAERVGKPVAVGAGRQGRPARTSSRSRYDGRRLNRFDDDDGPRQRAGRRGHADRLLRQGRAAAARSRPGDRLAPLNAALMDLPRPRVRRRAAGRSQAAPDLR